MWSKQGKLVLIYMIIVLVITGIITYNSLRCLLIQKNARVVTIDDYEQVPANDELALKKAVANQPISVAIEAAGREFQLYVSVSFFISFMSHLKFQSPGSLLPIYVKQYFFVFRLSIYLQSRLNFLEFD